MNTKQLWNALILNPVTNKYCDGIFSIDTLQDIKEKPTLIICNTDPSYKPGEHWILFFFYDNSVDFFDSLGRDITYYGSEFIDFVKNFANDYKYTVKRTQPIGSDVCGHYCLYYGFKICNDISMQEIILDISNNDDVVDFVNKMFYICESSHCSLLQYCNRC